jgi:arabinose-5-phosphate isomerase
MTLTNISNTTSQNIQIARKVLDIEIEGIKALENALDSKFDDAVEKILSLKGKLVISGMGKSGHIARKIAATFASTGTPAIFVHPAEASHGDLGMISTDDICILLSNSGETAELRDVVFYCKRFQIPIIAIVRRSGSTLVEAADIPFVLPATPEASPVAAPTTSTTMMLAWGDALSMAVMHRKGFSNDDFGVFHPGGKLGSQFIKVSQLMKSGADLPIVAANDTMDKVLVEMTQKSLGCAVVCDAQNKITGIITDGDLRRHMSDIIVNKTAAEVAGKNPKTIRENMLAVEALGIMNSKNITSLIVADEQGILKGILHIHQVLSAGVN